MKFVKQKSTDLEDFLCKTARQNAPFAISSSSANLIPNAIASLEAGSIGDDSGISVLVTLDQYRLKAVQAAVNKQKHCSLSEDAQNGKLLILSCSQLESYFRQNLTNPSLPQSHCWRLVLIINDLDLGSLGLAQFEWVVDNIMGTQVPITYLIPSSFISSSLILWLEKRGIMSLHCFESLNQPNSNKLPQITFKNRSSASLDLQSAIIISQNRIELDRLAEQIHRKGGKTHSYYNDGTTRGTFKKNDSALLCLPGIDTVPIVHWKQCLCIAPTTSSYLFSCCGAVETDSFAIHARNKSELLACMALASSENNDLETLLPGPFSRAIIGAYQTYKSLHQDIPISLNYPGCQNRFLSETVPQLISYWESIGLVDHTYSGSIILTEKGRTISAGFADPTQIENQWEHSRSIEFVDPNGDLLQFDSPLKLAFYRSKQMKIGELNFESAINEYSSNGTWILRRASSERRSLWNDTSGAIFGHDGAAHLRSILKSGYTPNDKFNLDEDVISIFDKYRDEIADIIQINSNSFIENSNNRVKWWTFGGGILNASLTSVLLLDNRAFDVRFSNCAIEFSVRQKDSGNAQLLQSIINDVLSICSAPTDDQLNALTNTWFWVPGVARWFVLLGITWQKTYIKKVLAKQKNLLLDLCPQILPQTDSLHILMEEPFAPLPQPPEQLKGQELSSRPNTYTSASTPASPSSKFINSHSNFLPRYADGYYRLERGDGSQLHTRLPWYLINSEITLNEAVNHIMKEPFIGLDVETTLFDQKLCFVQIGCRDCTFLIDPLMVSIFPLVQVFSNPRIIKVIHNKTFECSVLGKLGIQIHNIIDTCTVSRKTHGSKDCYGNRISHKLSAVSLREFNYTMDKTNQTSRWEVRPLSESQLEYAALDAEILVHLYHHYFMKTT